MYIYAKSIKIYLITCPVMLSGVLRILISALCVCLKALTLVLVLALALTLVLVLPIRYGFDYVTVLFLSPATLFAVKITAK